MTTTTAPTWTVPVTVTDHGPWNPDEITSLVGFGAACIESGIEVRCVLLDGQHVDVYPGQHLVSLTYPGRTVWQAMGPNELEQLREGA